jgi:hypothetical protein
MRPARRLSESTCDLFVEFCIPWGDGGFGAERGAAFESVEKGNEPRVRHTHTYLVRHAPHASFFSNELPVSIICTPLFKPSRGGLHPNPLCFRWTRPSPPRPSPSPLRCRTSAMAARPRSSSRTSLGWWRQSFPTATSRKRCARQPPMRCHRRHRFWVLRRVGAGEHAPGRHPPGPYAQNAGYPNI